MAIKRVGVLTSGGDASGMNAAVRAVVRTALDRGLEIFGIHEGFAGLIEGGDRVRPMTWNSVGGIIHRGGTILGTARSEAFRTREGRLAAARTLVAAGIDSLIVIGGDGSLTGADVFRREWPGLVEELVGERRRGAGRRRAPPPPHGGRPRRVDRQRRVRHRHDDRRRHGAPPDHRGDRRHQQHRVQPPADVRRRGDGPALRLPRADGRHRDGRRLGVHPRAPAGDRRLGGRDGGGAQGRARGRAARRHRRRGRRRHRSAGAADHQRAPAGGAGGRAGRIGAAHRARARPARRRAERVRPQPRHDHGPRGGRGAARRARPTRSRRSSACAATASCGSRWPSACRSRGRSTRCWRRGTTPARWSCAAGASPPRSARCRRCCGRFPTRRSRASGGCGSPS